MNQERGTKFHTYPNEKRGGLLDTVMGRFMGITGHERQVGDPRKTMYRFFTKASSSIKAVVGELNPEFWGHGDTEKLLESLQGKQVTIEIIYSSAQDETEAQEQEGLVRALLELGVKMYRLDRRPDLHFTVVDGKHLKLERYHPRGVNERAFYLIHDAEYLARAKELEFHNLRSLAVEQTRQNEPR